MAEQENPISFRPYPPIKQIMDAQEKPYKVARKHFNRNHYINQCIAMSHDYPVDMLESYRRGERVVTVQAWSGVSGEIMKATKKDLEHRLQIAINYLRRNDGCFGCEHECYCPKIDCGVKDDFDAMMREIKGECR